MSDRIDDQTGEYHRHQRNIRWSRRGALLNGGVYILLGGCGALFFLYEGITLLWTHDSTWLYYGLDVILLAYCAFLISTGWRDIHRGRQTISQEEVLQAKQQHRLKLLQAVHGKLPITYSRGSRVMYLGMTVFFGLLAGTCWYLFQVAHGPALLGFALVHSCALLVALLGFVASYGGQAYRQASANELRHIHWVGEFSASPMERRAEEGE